MTAAKVADNIVKDNVAPLLEITLAAGEGVLRLTPGDYKK